ncbi:alpha/beta hydrolase [Acinetobacter kookii]|uniref:Pimeloyl-ACP methyl ester carboxylesterase n=1 Tax=Acinetobacter kookii TaxID=1226327 RepID=A0A1G6PHL1_9GAMM|nr:alpha/beta hydrolase [Acinetobacter kookii]SDC78825.1 Pimeloyl-ACP methyl ester carboxylesterase [Acinetobacter kookii]
MSILAREYQLSFDSYYLYAKSWQSTEANPELAPIILMHDSLGSVALWRDFPAQLAAQTKRIVYAYDRLGFGQSAVNHQPLGLDFVITEATHGFKAVLDYFALKDFIVLGHSVGGGMSAAIAAEYSQRCQALVTIAAQYEVEERTLAGIREAKQAFRQAGQMERLAKYHADKAQWVLDAWTETWLAPAFKDWNLSQVLPQVQCPSLIIHGEQDEYGTLAQPRQIFAGVKGAAELQILEDLHHMPHKEQPELVLALISEFLAEIS